ncbi:MAG: tRNA (adenosine(37)-N6)-threonylcarbamoyltransferase complex transferase subunit TsaD [Clostridiales bacterium]|nr:tRNA (adenosine(37)-N6)-threonylcarbamoyltransferase complex transferase subunit TsaD [Clostridiales bacterium]
MPAGADFKLVLGIETSCDETSASVVQGGREVLSNVISSQIDIHRPFGGVVPEIAARKHIERIGAVVDEALAVAGCQLTDIDAYAVANGPGLVGALLVGLSYAKALAFAQAKPLIGVNHIEGHICANYLNGGIEPPFLSLVVSGGHTLLIAVRDYNQYEVLGGTRDDAAGEAFDKAARALGLPYPGGPAIDRLSREGDANAVRFPRTKLEGLDFSFSGLKSAVIQYLERERKANSGISDADMAASFQKAAVDVLIDRMLLAVERTGYKTVALAGGVAANRALREAAEVACIENNLELRLPALEYCTDNAAMVACRGYYSLIAGKRDGYDLNAHPARMAG